MLIELKRAMVVAKTTLVAYGLRKIKSTTPKIRVGKNASFKCSHVLSFTALKAAINILFPLNLNKK